MSGETHSVFGITSHHITSFHHIEHVTPITISGPCSKNDKPKIKEEHQIQPGCWEFEWEGGSSSTCLCKYE